MSLIYITGISGAGKSTVQAELRKRGYRAYDADDDGLAAFFETKTGQEVEYSTAVANNSPGWSEQHQKRLVRDRVRKLSEEAKEITFLVGAVGNEQEVWDLFDKVFCLTVDEATLRERIANRTNNNFGKTPKELEHILKWHAFTETKYRDLGAIMVDTGQPVGIVVDQILLQL